VSAEPLHTLSHRKHCRVHQPSLCPRIWQQFQGAVSELQCVTSCAAGGFSCGAREASAGRQGRWPHTRGKGSANVLHSSVGVPTRFAVTAVGGPTICSTLFRIRNKIEILTSSSHYRAIIRSNSILTRAVLRPPKDGSCSASASILARAALLYSVGSIQLLHDPTFYLTH
jgi:hypothetical protein